MEQSSADIYVNIMEVETTRIFVSRALTFHQVGSLCFTGIRIIEAKIGGP